MVSCPFVFLFSLGRLVGVEQGLTELLNIPNSARVVNLKFPRPGAWNLKVLLCNLVIVLFLQIFTDELMIAGKLNAISLFVQVSCSGRHTLRVTGVSNLDFRAGFSSVPVSEFNHTKGRPVKGTLH